MMKWLLCLALCLVVVTQTGAKWFKHKHLTRKANFHIGELKAIVEEMDEMQTIHKFSTTLGSNDEIVDSLRSLCVSIHPSTKSNRKPTVDSKGDKQIVFPLKLEAKLDNNTLYINLTIKHSSNVFMALHEYRDQQKRLLTVPEVSKDNGDLSKTSLETFTFDLSQHSPYAYGFAHFIIYPTSIQKLDNRSNIWPEYSSTDYSLIDFKFSEVISNVRKAPNNELSVNLDSVNDIDKFQVVNGSDKTTLPNEGAYRTVVDLELEDITDVHVNVLLWDWDAKAYKRDRMKIDTRRNENGSLYIELRSRTSLRSASYLSGAVLKQRTVNETVTARVAILVNIGKGRMSGVLTMGYKTEFTYNDGDEIDYTAAKMFMLKLPNKMTAFPPGELEMDTHKEVSCNGQVHENPVGRYEEICRIKCRVVGTDIASMAITKTSPYNPLEHHRVNASYIHQYGAFAIYDMPTPSTLNAGRYKCAATTKTGKIKTEEIELTVSGPQDHTDIY